MKTKQISKFQEQFWLLNMLSSKSPAYNIPTILRFDQHPNLDWIETALNLIVERHEILRSSFEYKDGTIIQNVHPFTDNYIQIQSELVDFEKDDDLITYIKNKEIHKPFVLSAPTLLRCSYFKNSKDNVGYLCIVFHHIVVDLHSKGIFENELETIYSAFSKGEVPVLQPINSQYSDYSEWHNNLLQTEKIKQSITNWVGQLPDVNNKLHLPLDFDRPKYSKLLGKRILFSLTSEQFMQIDKCAKEQSIHTFIFLLSCYAIFIHKISGQSKIVIGVPYSNRKEEKFRETFGPFVNALPLVVDMEDNMPLSLIFNNVRNQMLINHRKQEIPFTTLVAYNPTKRDTSINPYFQTGFTFEPPMQLKLNEHTSVSLPIERDGAQLDLFVTMWENNSEFHGYFEYSSELFKESTAKKWIEQFKLLISNISLGTYSNTDDIKLTKTSLDNENGFYRTVSLENEFVHKMFEKQALLSLEKQAIFCNNESINYSDLNKLSDQIAQYLRNKGVSDNDVVGFSLNRSILMVACVMGILKAGAAYLPLDPSFPGDRLSYMLNDSESKLLITETALTNSIETNVEKLLIDQTLLEVKNTSVHKLENKISSDSLAYMIYTSGSTGLPKGVKVHHGAVVNFIESMADIPGFSSTDTLLAVTTMSFDISVLEIFLPLYKGGSIVLAQKKEVINGSALIHLIDKYNVTVLQGTPATWNILINSKWNGKSELKALCGGEPIPSNLIKLLLPKVSQLWNMYGPTETTVWSTCVQITSVDPPVLVGKPINNTSIYILTEANEVVSNGEKGEVCIGGLGVTKGYHKRDELTKSRFIYLQNGELIYKTGDLGRILTDGQIELFGRIDNQIKLRGFRIEPGEIEVQICKTEGIIEAVVKVQLFGDFDHRLVAFLKINNNFTLDTDKLIKDLKEKLPEYMVPLHYKILSDFVRTPNGKVDKNKLIFEDSEITIKEKRNTKKVTNLKELETNVLEIWREVLKNDRITINDNFFDIGGNSLLLIQVSNAINQLLDREIEIIYLFEFPTINGLCKHLATTIFLFSTESTTESSRLQNFRNVSERRRRN